MRLYPYHFRRAPRPHPMQPSRVDLLEHSVGERFGLLFSSHLPSFGNMTAEHLPNLERALGRQVEIRSEHGMHRVLSLQPRTSSNGRTLHMAGYIVEPVASPFKVTVDLWSWMRPLVGPDDCIVEGKFVIEHSEHRPLTSSTVWAPVRVLANTHARISVDVAAEQAKRQERANRVSDMAAAVTETSSAQARIADAFNLEVAFRIGFDTDASLVVRTPAALRRVIAALDPANALLATPSNDPEELAVLKGAMVRISKAIGIAEPLVLIALSRPNETYADTLVRLITERIGKVV